MFKWFSTIFSLGAPDQCESSDFDFCIAEHNKLLVLKICSDEGRDDCQQLKPKGLRLLLELL